jgi:hypothetical protein
VGVYSVYWDGKDARSVEVGSGIYFCRLEASDQAVVKKLVMLK